MFTAIVVSVVSLRGVANAARLALKTLLWFGITALIAVSIGIGIGLLTNPGKGVTLDLGGAAPPKNTGSWTDFLTGIVPTNPVGAFVEGNVLQIVFLAVVIGAAALLVGDAAEPFVALNRSLLEIVQKALWWVIRLAPIGTLGLIGNAVASYGWDLLAPREVHHRRLRRLRDRAVRGLPAGADPRRSTQPAALFAGAWPAIELAFVSRSSVGTMPVTQRSVERLGVPREYASFAVPFGATTKMDGCAAIYPALAAIFVAQVFGVHLGVGDYLLIAFVSVVGSAATAGLTGAIVMLTLTLSTLGLPLAGAGLLLAIDPILDMIRTATNVAGQALVPTVVAAREGTLDRAAYESAGRRDLTDPEPVADNRPELTPVPA
ncbi:dicarboxylate/amino acid:cation symporter [Micromonospora sp. M12]